MASQGDPRVLIVLNFLLSGAFSAAVVSGLDFVGLLEFSWTMVGLATAALMVVTWVMIMQ